MSKPWNPGVSSTEFEEVSGGFRGDLDPEKLVWLQIRMCNALHSQGDDILFGNAVMSLFAIIPSSIRIEIESPELESLYYITEMKWVPKRGLSADPERPFIINKREDLDYDPTFNNGEPLQISPVEEPVEKWDYYSLFKLILEKLEEKGLTWHVQRIEKITGNEWDPAKDTKDDEDDSSNI